MDYYTQEDILRAVIRLRNCLLLDNYKEAKKVSAKISMMIGKRDKLKYDPTEVSQVEFERAMNMMRADYGVGGKLEEVKW